MGGGEVAGGMEGFLICQEYQARRRVAHGMADGSYALGLFAERVLLLAKLGFEEEAVKVGGIGRGGLLCKSICH